MLSIQSSLHHSATAPLLHILNWADTNDDMRLTLENGFYCLNSHFMTLDCNEAEPYLMQLALGPMINLNLKVFLIIFPQRLDTRHGRWSLASPPHLISN